MYRPLAEQWLQAQAELRARIAEAERIGEALVELGQRLKADPWRWALGWMATPFPSGETPQPVEPEMEEALDRNRLSWLLDDIRLLRRREAELRRLLNSPDSAQETAAPRARAARG